MSVIELLKIIVLGIVEGITEWLPISSTGHLILAETFLKIPDASLNSDFMEMFDVVIQLGAILAVIVIYFKRLWPVKTVTDATDGAAHSHPAWDHEKLWLWLKILVACIPAGVIGVLFNDKIDELFYNAYVVSIALIVYGVAFILIEIFNKKRDFKVKDVKSFTFRTALIIGAFQLLALIPGTSRSGATILGAMLIGVDRTPAAEFTFFLAIPVMLGASLLKILKFVMNNGLMTGAQTVYLIVGMVVAFGVSIAAIKFLMAFIKGHDFKAFGIYRIVVGVAFLVLALSGLVTVAP